MPYQRLAEQVVARWREVERALEAATDEVEAEDLRAQAALLRDEYQRLVKAIREPGHEAEALKVAVATIREAIERGEHPRLHAIVDGEAPAVEVRVVELPGIFAVAHDHRMVQSVAANLAASALDVPEDAVEIDFA